MASTKRARACDACHSIKIKCELGTIGGTGPCERCVRLGKECTVTPPRSQKDRVAELEAQVATLTWLLESQGIASDAIISGGPRPETEGSVASGLAPTKDLSQKKRKLENDKSVSDSPASSFAILAKLDSIVSKDLQRRLLVKYKTELVPLVPFVPIDDQLTYTRLRDEQSVLLQAIIYASSSGILSGADQERLGRSMLDAFDGQINSKGQKSVHLIQAIQIAVLWYRSPKNHRQIASFQLAQCAMDMSRDIGLSSALEKSSLGSTDAGGPIDPAIALRTWLVCHMLASNIKLLMRAPDFIKRGELDQFSIHMLVYAESGASTDRILCQCVRAENLCEQIATSMKLLGAGPCVELADPETQLLIQRYQNAITDWKIQMPSAPSFPTYRFYEYAATLYLHEIALHTATNGQSFTAPYLAERLSIPDFPAPFVTESHIASIYALRSAAHAFIEGFVVLETTTWTSLPFLPHIARVTYALYILAKLFIAASGKGNTFGAYIDPESLLLEKYLDRMILIATSVRQEDPNCPTARLLLAPTRMKEWLLECKKTIANNTASDSSNASFYTGTEITPATVDLDSFEWTDLASYYNQPDWELVDFMADPVAPTLFTEALYDASLGSLYPGS